MTTVETEQPLSVSAFSMEVAEGVTLTDSIGEKLIQFIARNHLKAGDQLPSEKQLTEMLKVSRLPLREALARLRALGVIAVRQGKGAFVCPVNATHLFRQLSPMLRSQGPRNLVEMMEVRQVLETAATRLAAQRRSQNDLVNLRRGLDGMRATLRHKADFIQHDMAFHRQLATATGNPTFELLLNTIHHAVAVTQWSYVDDVAARELSLDHHERIYEAIAHRNPSKAAAAMKKHLRDVQARLSPHPNDKP